MTLLVWPNRWYITENKQFSENKLFGYLLGPVNILFHYSLFRCFLSSIKRLVPIFSLLTIFKALKARNIRYNVCISFHTNVLKLTKFASIYLEWFHFEIVRLKNISIFKHIYIFNLGMWDKMAFSLYSRAIFILYNIPSNSI